MFVCFSCVFCCCCLLGFFLGGVSLSFSLFFFFFCGGVGGETEDWRSFIFLYIFVVIATSNMCFLPGGSGNVFGDDSTGSGSENDSVIGTGDEIYSDEEDNVGGWYF